MGAADIFKYKQRKTGLTKRPVIKGDFSTYKINHKELGIYKVNRLAASFLTMLVLFSICSYTAVLFREKIVKDVHAETNKIYYENIELQNKVDTLKSFYSIDNKVSKINFLKKPDKVIEVKAVDKTAQKTNGNNSPKNNLKQMPAGF